MKHHQKCYLLILAAAIAALALRLPRLEQRPMHTDEAVHAIKFGELLEKGRYTYDPNEYHGPTLNYLTLIPAWLSSADQLTETKESTLRIVPVFFGVLLVLLTLMLVDGLGWTAVATAALAAISPAMVFYSRYYIQEMLLACFTFGVIACAWCYLQRKSPKWAVLVGVFLALSHATKETSIIAFGCMLLAVVLTLLVYRWQGGPTLNIASVAKPWHIIMTLAIAIIISALFYSSFLSSFGGVLDSLRAYVNYLSKAGDSGLHNHPWYYYLKMLIYSRYGGGPAWSEGLILILAIAGFVAAMTGGVVVGANANLLRFFAFYTLLMTVSYSLIPYKTPWCLLSFFHGMIILAAVGVVAVIKQAPSVLARTIIVALLAASAGHLAWQAYLGSYRFYADPANPYVYAHTSTDVYTIVQRLKDIAAVHPDRCKMPIQIICPGHDYWPLPWYLRRFESVGYWDHVDMDVPAAPVMIVSPSVEADLNDKFYVHTPFEKRQMYLFLFDERRYVLLRPGVRLLGLVRKDLWDLYQQQQRE